MKTENYVEKNFDTGITMIKGTSLSVLHILSLLTLHGLTIEQILERYPELSLEKIVGCKVWALSELMATIGGAERSKSLLGTEQSEKYAGANVFPLRYHQVPHLRRAGRTSESASVSEQAQSSTSRLKKRAA